MHVKAGDVVARGRPEESGLFERCIPIGEWRRGAYRVREDLLSEWDGLDIKDGWIQRSANPPEFKCPSAFKDWFQKQGISTRPSTVSI